MKTVASKSTKKSDVVSFQSFSLRRKEQEYLARGRQPLYVSHSRSLVKSENALEKGKTLSNFGDRISQMRQKIKKIDDFVGRLNQLKDRQPRG